MVPCVAVQRDASFLCPILEARCIGNASRKGSVPGSTCLRHRGLANGGPIMIEDRDGGQLAGQGGIAPRHLHGIGQLLCALRRGERHAIACHVGDLPDAAVGVEFQAAERERDGRAARRRILDQHDRSRIMRPAPAYDGRGSSGIPPQDELGKVLGGGDRAEPPLLKPLARIHLVLLKFGLIACQVGIEALESHLRERPGFVRPLEFPVQVNSLFWRRMPFILAGVRVNLPGEERIVVTQILRKIATMV